MKKREITEIIIKRFQEKMNDEEKSRATIDKYLRDIRAFSSYAQCGDLKKETVIAYKQDLIRRGYAIRSINSMLASLNSLFSFLGWLDLRVKMLKIQQRVYYPEEKELTTGEYERLCRTALKRNKQQLCLIIQTICGTGIRVSELQYITVEAVRKGEATVSLKGKTRTVFLVRALKMKLLSYIQRQKLTTGPVFITKKNKPIDRTEIWREMKGLCQEAEVNPQKVFPHNLRHLFARTFYGIDKDIAKLADVLGHSSINTTRIYIMSTGAEHRCRMEQLGLII